MVIILLALQICLHVLAYRYVYSDVTMEPCVFTQWYIGIIFALLEWVALTIN